MRDFLATRGSLLVSVFFCSVSLLVCQWNCVVAEVWLGRRLSLHKGVRYNEGAKRTV